MPGFRIGLTVTALAAALACAGVQAQVVERNLPPVPRVEPAEPAPPNITPASQDDTPLGPKLTGVALLGTSDAVKAAGTPGIDAALVPRMNTPEGRALLAPFLGQPLSRQLIGRIEAAIARHYRDLNRSFVSLSTPEQNITAGVLQVRVVEFHAGKITEQGAQRAGEVRAGVRLTEGGEIDTSQLGQDIDWLNRYPFRHVDAVFTPSDETGRSDVTLQATETKPWRVYAGFSNSGTPQTEKSRYFVGASVGGLLRPGSVLSYQGTASPRGLGGWDAPSYMSHALRFTVPTGQRQNLEGAFNYVRSNSLPNAVITGRQRIWEFSLGYRWALSNAVALPGELVGGVEIKKQNSQTLFQGTNFQQGSAKVYQFYGGYAHAWANALGQGSLSLMLHVSPGALGSGNRGRDFSSISNGRVTHAQYAYGALQLDEVFRLPKRWSLTESLIAQASTRALPDSEQMALGGQSLVRGYSLNDGAFDSGVVLRSQLGTPVFTFNQAVLAPYVFVDLGHGSGSGVNNTRVTAASVGAGVSAQISSYASVSLDYAHALKKAPTTRAHDNQAMLRLSVGF